MVSLSVTERVDLYQTQGISGKREVAKYTKSKKDLDDINDKHIIMVNAYRNNLTLWNK